MELYWETAGLHRGHMTPVVDQNQRVCFLIRRSVTDKFHYHLMNADAKLIGDINNSAESPMRFNLRLGCQNAGTLIHLVGTTRPFDVMWGRNWLITGDLAAHHFSGYCGLGIVFSATGLNGGASMRLRVNREGDQAAAILTVCVLDQLRKNYVMVSSPLSYLW